MRTLALQRQENLWTDKLDIFLVERDDAARHTKICAQRLGLHLKPETYQRVLREGIEFEELWRQNSREILPASWLSMRTPGAWDR